MTAQTVGPLPGPPGRTRWGPYSPHVPIQEELCPHHHLDSSPSFHHCPPYKKLEPRAGSSPLLQQPSTQHRVAQGSIQPWEDSLIRKGGRRISGFPPGDCRPGSKVGAGVSYPKAPSQPLLETRSHGPARRPICSASTIYSQQVSHGVRGAALLGTVLKTSTGPPAILGAVVNKPEHQVLSGLQGESAGLARGEAWGVFCHPQPPACLGTTQVRPKAARITQCGSRSSQTRDPEH